MNRGAEIALYAMMLILPLSALLARRVPLGQTLKMVLAWIAVFAIGLVIVGQRDRLKPIWDDTRDALFGRDQRVIGETVRIRMAADGHFWATVNLNGVERRMLIDSGATTTALSTATARAAGLQIDESGFPTMLGTANGDVVALNAELPELRIGGIVARDLPVVVADAFGDTDVLGMNFLSRLASWRVDGTTLILELPPTRQ
ncbi:TIGR02281 family clan AA aspartic protease [Sphingomonas sp. SUN019]|uniref:retropepsin-like aspartic protease family protein n=1 Tax=Sphingomonas sp. SUN019 TaxID=2937788 RepID=UPI002164A382|nr:TIGR02281 family clan AA aspartic protease [Sphingomonas sp. SUN019]UVO49236.1 TIGR02281 family clan AA aspartic protease [Sphingomonas sp. SUN019]